MKYFIISLLLFSFNACSDDCQDGSVTNNLEGKWVIINPIGTAAATDQVTFNSDLSGTGTEKGSFFETDNSSNSYMFNWLVNSNQDSLKLTYTNGVVREFKINSHSCDQIVLDAIVANWTLNKQ